MPSNDGSIRTATVVKIVAASCVAAVLLISYAWKRNRRRTKQLEQFSSPHKATPSTSTISSSLSPTSSLQSQPVRRSVTPTMPYRNQPSLANGGGSGSGSSTPKQSARHGSTSTISPLELRFSEEERALWDTLPFEVDWNDDVLGIGIRYPSEDLVLVAEQRQVPLISLDFAPRREGRFLHTVNLKVEQLLPSPLAIEPSSPNRSNPNSTSSSSGGFSSTSKYKLPRMPNGSGVGWWRPQVKPTPVIDSDSDDDILDDPWNADEETLKAKRVADEPQAEYLKDIEYLEGCANTLAATGALVVTGVVKCATAMKPQVAMPSHVPPTVPPPTVPPIIPGNPKNSSNGVTFQALQWQLPLPFEQTHDDPPLLPESEYGLLFVCSHPLNPQLVIMFECTTIAVSKPMPAIDRKDPSHFFVNSPMIKEKAGSWPLKLSQPPSTLVTLVACTALYSPQDTPSYMLLTEPRIGTGWRFPLCFGMHPTGESSSSDSDSEEQSDIKSRLGQSTTKSVDGVGRASTRKSTASVVRMPTAKKPMNITTNTNVTEPDRKRSNPTQGPRIVVGASPLLKQRATERRVQRAAAMKERLLGTAAAEAPNDATQSPPLRSALTPFAVLSSMDCSVTAYYGAPVGGSKEAVDATMKNLPLLAANLRLCSTSFRFLLGEFGASPKEKVLGTPLDARGQTTNITILELEQSVPGGGDRGGAVFPLGFSGLSPPLVYDRSPNTKWVTVPHILAGKKLATRWHNRVVDVDLPTNLHSVTPPAPVSPKTPAQIVSEWEDQPRAKKKQPSRQLQKVRASFHHVALPVAGPRTHFLTVFTVLGKANATVAESFVKFGMDAVRSLTLDNHRGHTPSLTYVGIRHAVRCVLPKCWHVFEPFLGDSILFYRLESTSTFLSPIKAFPKGLDTTLSEAKESPPTFHLPAVTRTIPPAPLLVSLRSCGADCLADLQRQYEPSGQTASPKLPSTDLYGPLWDKWVTDKAVAAAPPTANVEVRRLPTPQSRGVQSSATTSSAKVTRALLITISVVVDPAQVHWRGWWWQDLTSGAGLAGASPYNPFGVIPLPFFSTHASGIHQSSVGLGTSWNAYVAACQPGVDALGETIPGSPVVAVRHMIALLPPVAHQLQHHGMYGSSGKNVSATALAPSPLQDRLTLALVSPAVPAPCGDDMLKGLLQFARRLEPVPPM